MDVVHHITQETMQAFLQREREKGASANMLRRFQGSVKMLYEALPEDKLLTREGLLVWRKGMEEKGYSSVTVGNYVKYINRYLDFVACPQLRFSKGKSKDITGMTFGYLTAMEPTGEKKRGDLVWRFSCKCGNVVQLPATRALQGNTLSCGCLKGERLRQTRKFFAGTSLSQSLSESVESTRAASGYTGVTPKGDKWQANIKYRGVRYFLGSYWDKEEAVKARGRAKELVMEDAQGLLELYKEWEQSIPPLPQREKQRKNEAAQREESEESQESLEVLRRDNTSGCRGVSLHKGKWDAKISYQKTRYRVGRFSDYAQAVQARKSAERLLKEDPDGFRKEYGNCLQKKA